METTLTHRIDGNGPALVLLNGGLMSIAAWDPVATRLATDFRVVRFDFRGQLLSPGPAHATLTDHADDVITLLDQLDIDDAHLVGASFGAEVALILAARHPSRVRSLTCVTATDRLTESMAADSIAFNEAVVAAARGGDGGRVFEILAEHTFSDAWRAANTDVIAQRINVFRMMPPAYFQGLEGVLRALATLDVEKELETIPAPTLVVGAALDRTFPVEHSEALARKIPAARLEIVDGVAHGAIVEATDTVIDIVLGFLETVEAAPARLNQST